MYLVQLLDERVKAVSAKWEVHVTYYARKKKSKELQVITKMEALCTLGWLKRKNVSFSKGEPHHKPRFSMFYALHVSWNYQHLFFLKLYDSKRSL